VGEIINAKFNLLLLIKDLTNDISTFCYYYNILHYQVCGIILSCHGQKLTDYFFCEDRFVLFPSNNKIRLQSLEEKI